MASNSFSFGGLSSQGLSSSPYRIVSLSAFESQNFGTGFVEAILGPSATWLSNFTNSMRKFLQGKPKALARTIVLATPILNQLAGEKKEELIESIEESIEDRSESFGDVYEEMFED